MIINKHTLYIWTCRVSLKKECDCIKCEGSASCSLYLHILSHLLIWQLYMRSRQGKGSQIWAYQTQTQRHLNEPNIPIQNGSTKCKSLTFICYWWFLVRTYCNTVFNPARWLGCDWIKVKKFIIISNFSWLCYNNQPVFVCCICFPNEFSKRHFKWYISYRIKCSPSIL